MADNSTLDPGSGGDTIRDKDRAGVKTQIVGIDINAAGSEVLGTGDATNGLDVDVTRVQGTVTVSGAVSVSAALPAGNNNIGDVDIASAPAQAADNGALPAVVDVVGGYDGTNVQVIKTDANGIVQTGVNGTVPVTDNGGSLTVDGTVTANAGTGTMAVSAASLPLPSGAATAAKQPALGTAGAAAADVLTVQGIASGVAQPVSGTVTANAGTGPFPVSDNAGSLTVDAPVATPVFVRLSDGSAAIATLPVSLASLPALVAGTATIGSVGLAPQTTGGLTTATLISAASTNATSVKGSAGQLFFIQATNINAAVRYLKFYNKASAPTVGTDTPVLTFAIPGNTAGAGFLVEVTNGLAFGTGIAYAITTGSSTADTGAVAASDIIVNLGYK